jgi:hypothetical protein
MDEMTSPATKTDVASGAVGTMNWLRRARDDFAADGDALSGRTRRVCSARSGRGSGGPIGRRRIHGHESRTGGLTIVCRGCGVGHAFGAMKVLRAGPAPLTLVSLGRWAKHCGSRR